MKRLATLILVPILLSLGACASSPSQHLETRYGIDGSGNLVERQVMVQDPTDNSMKIWETLGIIGLSFVGLYFVGEVFDVWDDDDSSSSSAPPPAAPVSPFVLPASSSGSFETNNSYILPDFQVVN